MANPDWSNYGLWQYVLWEVNLLRIELTSKSMLNTAQRVFEFGNKNGRLLAWLAKRQFDATYISGIRG